MAELALICHTLTSRPTPDPVTHNTESCCSTEEAEQRKWLTENGEIYHLPLGVNLSLFRKPPAAVSGARMKNGSVCVCVCVCVGEFPERT